MKYRVRLDLSFNEETDAQALMDYARGLASKAVNTNEGKDNEEISFIEKHKCYHDEGKECPRESKVRLELRNNKIEQFKKKI